jgi:hypothetical protein
LGLVYITTGSDIIVRGVRGDGADSSDCDSCNHGASVYRDAERNVQILDSISLRGGSTGKDLRGGVGGWLDVRALGSLSIAAPISPAVPDAAASTAPAHRRGAIGHTIWCAPWDPDRHL